VNDNTPSPVLARIADLRAGLNNPMVQSEFGAIAAELSKASAALAAAMRDVLPEGSPGYRQWATADASARGLGSVAMALGAVTDNPAWGEA
jgi:hypothetical protein